MAKTIRVVIRGKQIKIIKKEDHPAVPVLMTIGGNTEQGYFLSYQGDIEDVRDAISHIAEAIEGLDDSEVNVVDPSLN